MVQQNYVGGMLKQNAIDNVVHEHLEYYSLTSLQKLLDRWGFQVYRVELNDLNGGSFRTFICNKTQYPVENSVRALLEKEARCGLNTWAPFREFGERSRANIGQVRDYVNTEVEKGKRVYVYGASTRGNTLLQFAQLDHRQITAAAERNPEKWGKTTPGTEIPIISEDQARLEHPEYFLILPWFFVSEFEEREKEYLDKGGKFIVPLPRMRIIP